MADLRYFFTSGDPNPLGVNADRRYNITYTTTGSNWIYERFIKSKEKHLIKPERLDVLRFQAENNGLTPTIFEKLRKEGQLKKIPHGPMIVVSGVELRALLEAYEEKHNGRN